MTFALVDGPSDSWQLAFLRLAEQIGSVARTGSFPDCGEGPATQGVGGFHVAPRTSGPQGPQGPKVPWALEAAGDLPPRRNPET